jgi:tetrahydromethanopterin S-methyltransferase subunit F
VAAVGHRQRGALRGVDSLVQDIRYAVRALRRTPLFAATVAATMGLGLGLLGSAFTILNAYSSSRSIYPTRTRCTH